MKPTRKRGRPAKSGNIAIEVIKVEKPNLRKLASALGKIALLST